MAIILQKGGVDVSNTVVSDSVILSSVLTKEVSTLQFNVRRYSSNTDFKLGDQIDMYEDGVHIFGGTLTEIETISEGGILTANMYTATDWSFRLNSKLVIKSYTSMDPHDIVLDILSNFTDGTYTTANVATAGYTIPSIKFNYEQVTSALEKLAKQIGWEWYVDPDKGVHFFPPTTVVSAPFPIDDSSGNLEWVTLDIDQSIVNMKNSVYVIGGNYTVTFDATSTTDKYLTDGTKSIFPIGYPYTAATITVTLAGVAQTIGTDQVTPDTSVQVQYNQGGRFVRFTTVPTTGQTVKIYGSAQIPIVAHVQNQAAVAAYGEIQGAVIDSQIKSLAEAQGRANSEIAMYGSPVFAIKFSTLQKGFVVGQTVQVNSPIFGQNVLVVVKRITGKMYSNTQLHYDIECVGTEKVNFVDIMKVLLTQGNDLTVVNDSTVLQVLLLCNESVMAADTLNQPTTSSGPYVWG